MLVGKPLSHLVLYLGERAMGLQSATELIERGRLVYRAMRYREQAARYGAVANSLLEAIAVAEGGDATKLEVLLEELLRMESPQDPLLDGHEDLVALNTSVLRTSDLGRPQTQSDPTVEKQRIVIERNAEQNVEQRLEQAISQDIKQDNKQGVVRQTTAGGGARSSQAKTLPKQLPTVVTATEVTAERVATKGEATSKDTLRNGLKEPRKDTPTEAGKEPGKETRKDAGTDAGKNVGKNVGEGVGNGAVPLRKEHVAGKKHVTGPRRGKKRLPLDVMASVIVHGVLLLVLGAWFIAVVDPTPVLSVVAGTVETQEVLIETPMEADSELEKPLEEQMQGGAIEIPIPNSPQIGVEAIEAGALAVGLEKAEEVGGGLGDLQEIAGATAPGNRVVEGAEFFGTKATGNTFVYIVDASPSMRRDRAFDAAKREILQSLGSMKPKQRFSILFFGGVVDRIELEPGRGGEQLISATPENLAKAVQWMQNVKIQPEGKVPIEAVRVALEMDPDGIFLLFDGDTKLDNWTEAIAELNRSDGLLGDGTPMVPIHVIHFFREEFQRSMQWLATSNRGTYRFVPRPSVVGKTLD